MLAKDEQEWLGESFPQFNHLIDELGLWVPRRKIAGIISVAGSIYTLDQFDTSDNIPLLLGHGVCDSIVHYKTGTYFNCPTSITTSGSYDLACRAKQLDKPYSLHSVTGLGHGWPDSLNNEMLKKMRRRMKDQIICGQPVQEEYVYLEMEEDCGVVDTELVSCEVSAVEESSSGRIRIYPNPTFPVIHYETDTHIAYYNYRVFDIHGKIILTGKTTLSIDVSLLQDGYYIIQFQSANKMYSSVGSFIKS